jgi:hypothetical protein
MKLTTKETVAGIMFIILMSATNVMAQNEILANTRVSLETSDSKSLTKFFNDMVEISFDGDKKNYTKTQAEFVLKDFFKKYPPVAFEFIHQGSSKEGLKYAIGKYTHSKGSFRVYILIKQFKGNYLIDTLDFSEE